MTELHLDGNGLAGLLSELLNTEATMVERRCQGCGSVHVLGAHRAYLGVARVLRCPGCDAVAAVIDVRADDVLVEWAGTLRLPRAG